MRFKRQYLAIIDVAMIWFIMFIILGCQGKSDNVVMSHQCYLVVLQLIFLDQLAKSICSFAQICWSLENPGLKHKFQEQFNFLLVRFALARF